MECNFAVKKTTYLQPEAHLATLVHRANGRELGQHVHVYSLSLWL